MKLYQPVNFPFMDDLVQATKNTMDRFIEKNIYMSGITIDYSLRSSINKYLEDRGISNLCNLLSFKRIDTEMDYKKCHLDCFADYSIINCSLIMPVSGCKNTAQYYYNGNYETENAITLGGSYFIKINWKDEGQYLDKVEISDSPVLCRTDVPHSAYSADGYRTTITLRFKNNESFEYLAERLSK